MKYWPMKYFLLLLIICVFASCDSERVFEQNTEFKGRTWKVSEPVVFDFVIEDPAQKYNLYYNVRNSLDYPYARIFVEYQLNDSTGVELSKKLVSAYLFDQKTGKPLGNSGLGDVFDHRFLLLEKQEFKSAGKYRLRLEQFNRQDTLKGVLAVGVRVETALP